MGWNKNGTGGENWGGSISGRLQLISAGDVKRAWVSSARGRQNTGGGGCSFEDFYLERGKIYAG